MKEFFTTLCIQFGNRSTAKKKVRFLNWLLPIFQTYGYKAEVINDKARFGRVCDVLLGDMKKAKHVILVPYDTPLKYTLANSVYYPLDGKRNRKIQLQNLLMQTLVSVVLMIAAIAITYYAMKQETAWKYGFMTLSFFLFLLAFWFGKGISNRYNFNRNSAAICVAMELAKDKNPAVAFVFVDATAQSYKGYLLLKAKYEELLQRKQVILLDCVGGNDPYHFLSVQACKIASLDACWQTIEQAEDSVLSLWKQAVLLTRAKQEGKDFKVSYTGTKKDTFVDFDALQEDVELLRQLIA